MQTAVEQAINRIKNYGIFKHIPPFESRKHLDTIIFVCAGLSNLKGPLIKEKDR